MSVSTDFRPPAVAGLFYPGDPEQLALEVSALLAETHPTPTSRPPKALIVPHAGYLYSGPTAAQAYALLAPWSDQIHRVVLLGPVHRVPVRGLATTGMANFRSPLGDVPIDTQAVMVACRLPQVTINDQAHGPEHALEVQLPFLQTQLQHFSLLPFAVGLASPAEVAEVIDLFWDDPATLIVISSDLSHYHPYAEAQQFDRATAEDILATRLLADHEQACGATPINGLLTVAHRRGLSPTLLDLRNSGDTAGDRQRVVGYGAFAIEAE